MTRAIPKRVNTTAEAEREIAKPHTGYFAAFSR
jgi:hypothetical protein